MKIIKTLFNWREEKEEIGVIDEEFTDSVKMQLLQSNARNTYANGGTAPNKYSNDQVNLDLLNNRTI